MTRCGQALLILSLLVPPFAVSAADSAADGNNVVSLGHGALAELHPVIVNQANDAVYSRNVDYVAYSLAEVLAKFYPDWKRLINNEAVLVFRASGDYEPFMLFSEAFLGTAYLATQIAGRSAERPYDCWTEGGEEHCDLGYFLIWTDGNYPDKPQPWGVHELEVVRFESAYGETIPRTPDPEVQAGYAAYKQYCIECHRVNFQGGGKATDHVIRGGPLTLESLRFFLHRYRQLNPASYMPDFSGVLSDHETAAIYRYIRHMSDEQNLCHGEPRDPRCP